MTIKLKRVHQCEKCPWKVSTDPHTIPHGYSEKRHQNLADTIAKRGDLCGISGLERPERHRQEARYYRQTGEIQHIS